MFGVNVVTSRTGTGIYKKWRTAVLTRDRRDGVRQCPLCGVEMDYDVGRKPNSAEPDHILPVKWGGRNTLENGRTICRRCNQSRGDGTRGRRAKQMGVSVVTVDVNW